MCEIEIIHRSFGWMGTQYIRIVFKLFEIILFFFYFCNFSMDLCGRHKNVEQFRCSFIYVTNSLLLCNCILVETVAYFLCFLLLHTAHCNSFATFQFLYIGLFSRRFSLFSLILFLLAKSFKHFLLFLISVEHFSSFISCYLLSILFQFSWMWNPMCALALYKCWNALL